VSRIVVLGAGSWGTTIAKVIADGGNEVTLWARRTEQVEQINSTQQNSLTSSLLNFDNIQFEKGTAV
jgi:glycerol-3-phosphate dehydrogenase (NAD(P)+)